MKRLFLKFPRTKLLIVSLFILGIVGATIGIQPKCGVLNLDAPQAQLAFSHGHCNLTASAFLNSVVINTAKDDFSDVTIDFEIDMKTVVSFNEWTDHLRSSNVFNVQETPLISFECRDNFKLGNGWFQIRGDLTINGVTRAVRFMLTPERITDSKSGKMLNRFIINGDVNLFDYEIEYSDLAGNPEFVREKIMFLNIVLDQPISC